MVDENPATVVYDETGVPAVHLDGAAVGASRSIFLLGGSDGTNLKVLKISSNGEAIVLHRRSGTAYPVTTAISGAGPATILAANTDRLEAFIEFSLGGTGILYIKLGTSPTSTDKSKTLLPGEEWRIPDSYTGIVTATWSAGATGSYSVTEVR